MIHYLTYDLSVTRVGSAFITYKKTETMNQNVDALQNKRRALRT